MVTESFEYVYQYKDHLGNIRLSYSDVNNNEKIDPNTEILDENNYYPFGLEHQGYNNVVVGAENNYKTYQSKELEKELGLNWHDFGARRYMADIGRWISPDPLADEFPSWSPYTAMNDNPTMFVDPTGMAAEDWYTNSGGMIVYNENINSQKDLNEAGIDGSYIGDSFIGEDQNSNLFYFNEDGSVTQSNGTASMLEGGGMNTSGIIQVESTLIDDGKNSLTEASLAATAVLISDDASGIGVVDDVLLPIAAGAALIGSLTESEATYSFGERTPPGSLVETQPDPTVFPYSGGSEKWSNKNYFPKGNGNGNSFMKWVIRAAGAAALGKKIYDGTRPKGNYQTKIDNTYVRKPRIIIP